MKTIESDGKGNETIKFKVNDIEFSCKKGETFEEWKDEIDVRVFEDIMLSYAMEIGYPYPTEDTSVEWNVRNGFINVTQKLQIY